MARGRQSSIPTERSAVSVVSSAGAQEVLDTSAITAPLGRDTGKYTDSTEHKSRFGKLIPYNYCVGKQDRMNASGATHPTRSAIVQRSGICRSEVPQKS